AVTGLAQDGKIISVRLVLFAEMVKGKAWTPATLQQIGGMAGVGGAFLGERFSCRTGPAPHPLHPPAAPGGPKAPLPESGTDIKGAMLAQARLLEASGYVGRPRDFAELLRILDAELRLITPTGLDGKDEGRGMRDEGTHPGADPVGSSLIPLPSSFRYY